MPGLLGSSRWFSGVFRVHLRQSAQGRHTFFTAPQVRRSIGFFFAVCSCPAFIVFAVLLCCFVLLFLVVFGFFGGFLLLRFQWLIVPGLTALGSCVVASPHPCFVGWAVLRLVACLFRWLIGIVCWFHSSLVLGLGSGASYRDCRRTGSGASYLVRLSPRPRR